jgi:NADP-dependent 3-hydroxy acid dehydrogenase YdfG
MATHGGLFSSIVVTGASSGIGEALARLYAAPGVALALTGRDGERLAQVADACRSAGATVVTGLVDVADRDAMATWLAEVDAAAPVDLCIANAGTSAGTGRGGESAEQVRRIFAVNVDGVFNTVHPLLPAMLARGRGQLALMSSLASFRGFPGAPAYCASKATVRVYGYVVSRMTAANRFPMPFLMPADRAAGIIARGIARNRARIAFPFPTYAGAWLLGVLPPGLTDPLLRRAPKKD